MKIKFERDLIRMRLRWVIEIEDAEITAARFDRIDRFLFQECAKSRSMADHLLALETFCRRIEESK